MSAGRRAAAQMSRGLSHPAGRGQSFVATARNSPTTKNSSRFDSGTSQTKCRLIRYRRLVPTMLFKSTLVPTSSHPAARPHQADSTSTSRRRAAAPVPNFRMFASCSPCAGGSRPRRHYFFFLVGAAPSVVAPAGLGAASNSSAVIFLAVPSCIKTSPPFSGTSLW